MSKRSVLPILYQILYSHSKHTNPADFTFVIKDYMIQPLKHWTVAYFFNVFYLFLFYTLGVFKKKLKMAKAIIQKWLNCKTIIEYRFLVVEFFSILKGGQLLLKIYY